MTDAGESRAGLGPAVLLGAVRSQLNTAAMYRRHLVAGDVRKLLTRYVEYLAGRSRAPLAPFSVNVLVTERCPLHCSMCSFDRHSGDAAREEFAPRDLERVVRAVGASRPIFFLSGGEPFAREDILDLVGIVASRGQRCMINTSGYVLTPRQIEAVAGLDVEAVVFSVYGSAEVHGGIVGRADAYERTVGAIRHLKRVRRRTALIASMTILPETIDGIEAGIDALVAAGIDRIKIEHLNFATPVELVRHRERCRDVLGRANTPCTFTHDGVFPQGFVAGVEALLLRLERGPHRQRVVVKPKLSRETLRRWYSPRPRARGSCFFCWHSLFIQPDGEVTPCQFMTDCGFGSIRQDDIASVWGNEEYRRMRLFLRGATLPVCSRCCKQ